MTTSSWAGSRGGSGVEEGRVLRQLPRSLTGDRIVELVLGNRAQRRGPPAPSQRLLEFVVLGGYGLQGLGQDLVLLDFLFQLQTPRL